MPSCFIISCHRIPQLNLAMRQDLVLVVIIKDVKEERGEEVYAEVAEILLFWDAFHAEMLPREINCRFFGNLC